MCTLVYIFLTRQWSFFSQVFLSTSSEVKILSFELWIFPAEIRVIYFMIQIWKMLGRKLIYLMIKKGVGYIWFCCLIYFIDYIVYKENKYFIDPLYFPSESEFKVCQGNQSRKCHWIFMKIVMGNLRMSWDFFFKSHDHRDDPDRVPLKLTNKYLNHGQV